MTSKRLRSKAAAIRIAHHATRHCDGIVRRVVVNWVNRDNGREIKSSRGLAEEHRRPTTTVKPRHPNNENEQSPVDTGRCSVCRELLVYLGQFSEMLEAVRKPRRSDWLTVDEIAQELRISKSIVYRLIRSGELEAVNLVVGEEGEIPRKGHFRVRRSALNHYLEAKRVKPLPNQPTCWSAPRLSKAKNHLGL